MMKKISRLKLWVMHAWLSCVHMASEASFISARRRAKLKRSATKRANKVLRAFEHLYFQGRKTVILSESFHAENASIAEGIGDWDKLIRFDLDPAVESYRILFIASHPPSAGHAGGLRMLDIMKMIRDRVPKVYLEVFCSSAKDLCGPLDKATFLADRVTIADDHDFSLTEYLRKQGHPVRYFDIVDFQFPQPLEVIEEYRAIGRKLLFTPMESLIRCDVIDGKADALKGIDIRSRDALLERAIVETVDRTVCVSDSDRDIVREFAKGDIISIETGISEIEFCEMGSVEPVPKTVCYVAYFGSETNRRALEWYLNNVHPLVLRAVPGYRFSIIGRGDVSELLGPDRKGIDYVGEVESIAPHIAKATVGIAPALFGAGFRGKINQYAYMGVPSVASPLAAKGLAFVHGDSIMIADQPEAFAGALVELLTNAELRDAMGQAARTTAVQHYSWDSKWPALAETYGLPETSDALAAPVVHAIVPSYQHAEYLEDRIRSIFAQEYPHLRVTVIDDQSTDSSDSVLRGLSKRFPFEYIRRDKNSGSPFASWKYAAEEASGDLIWICESDDTADPMFLARLVKLMSTRTSIKVAYCGSQIINNAGQVIGSTVSHFEKMFSPSRWRVPFIANGKREVRMFQRFGMEIPNMSSALIDRNVFRQAFSDEIGKYKLAGDWLFVGRVMQYGDVAYIPDQLNRFRSHRVTCRTRTPEIRRWAEHLSVRITLSVLSGCGEDFDLLEAARPELAVVLQKPDRLELVLAELDLLDHDSAMRLRSLLTKHLHNSEGSETFQRAMLSTAPFAA